MFEWTLQHIVCILGVGLLTGIAAYTDTKMWKIPNKLTLPFFALGWVYQIGFWGLPGLQDGLAAFAVGFGTYLLLFMVAGKTDEKGKPVTKTETYAEKQKRRILPFAIPVAMATWLLMLLNGAGIIKEGQLGPARKPAEQPAQVVER